MGDDDFVIDNIFKDKPKKLNSKKKGNRVELDLTKLLTAHFGKSFSRSVGSGNRWGQVTNMPAHARATFAGDICPPEGFKWVIECKGGYDDVDLNTLAFKANGTVDTFIAQSKHDAAVSERKSLIVWKRSRQPWLAILPKVEVEGLLGKFDCYFKYYDWLIVGLEVLLKNTDVNYWFEESKDEEKQSPSN